MASTKKPSDGTSAREALKAEMIFLASILEHHKELELNEQQFTSLSQMYWTRSNASTITEIVEAAASTLSSNQLYRAIALMAPHIAPPTRPGVEDATVQRIVTETLEKLSKDKQLVEIELASKAAERLMGWVKVFAFFLAAPAALGLIILAAFGVSKFEDVKGKITEAETKVATLREKVDPLLKYATKTQDDLASVQNDLAEQKKKFANLSDTVAKLSEKRRYALVIGNDTYSHLQLKAVAGASNDARDVAGALRTLGFSVKLLLNANFHEMSSELKRLQTDVTAGAEIAVVYFAGQSAAIQRETLLIPVDAIDDNVEATAITLSLAINAVSKTTRVGLVFIDACHNSGSVHFSGVCEEPLDRIPDNVVLGYAAEPGSIISDSKYARALSKYLVMPGLELIDMLERVSTEAWKESDKKQFTWKAEGPLSRPIYLKPAERLPPAAQ